jgi:RNA polymerase sigma-70 factor (ECF subfamily)
MRVDVDELLSAERAVGGACERSETTRWSLDESALIERTLAGDAAAFDQIVLQYQDMVFNLSYRLLGNRDEAVDLSQDVFLQVYRKLGTFRRDASLRTWLYRIVINLSKNRRRWWSRRFSEMTALSIDEVESGTSSAWELQAPVNGSLVPPDEALERKEAGELLRQAIDRLPFDQRTVLLLKEIEGLPYDEIGATLDIPLGTVKSRLARARKALRDDLDPKLFGLADQNKDV